MPTYSRICYHVVFATKERRACLSREGRPELFDYFAGILRDNSCFVHATGGVADHVHLLFALHPSVALADLVKDLKLASIAWIRESEGGRFQGFNGWQEGYAAFTLSNDRKERATSYIRNQEEHHRNRSYLEELEAMVTQAGLEYDERFPP